MQCLQHSYFQVGVRAPLQARSPASNSSALAKSALPAAVAAQSGSRLPVAAHVAPGQLAGQGAAASPLQQQRFGQQQRLTKELSHGARAADGGAQPGAAAYRQQQQPLAHVPQGSGGRDGARLSSLGSLSRGPRNARYKPGVQLTAAAAQDGPAQPAGGVAADGWQGAFVLASSRQQATWGATEVWPGSAVLSAGACIA